MADLTVTQAPVSVSLICDSCGDEIGVLYDDFCREHGSPCDWDYQTVSCPACGYQNRLDSWIYD